MITKANVNLYGETIGIVEWDNRYKFAKFVYLPQFIGRNIEPSPILMPVERGIVYDFNNLDNKTFQGLPGMLADCLPDTYGRALFDRWLALTNRTSGNPVESLCFLGKRCMGALEFEPALNDINDIDAQIEFESLVEVAQQALNEKSKFLTNLNDSKKQAIAQILRLGTSAGGQRAKAIIAYNKNTGEVRSGQIDTPEGFDYYIIKLDGVNATLGLRETENYGRLEYSFSLLAKECGITMSDCSLIEENGRAHFLTKRFDRQNGDKVHMQTLCGIAHYDYRLLRGYSYEQAFNIMRLLQLSYQELQDMFRRMVFNVVVRNQDDHTKNISFLMDKTGKWSLSPAYDMGYAYNPQGAWTSAHQMSINGKFNNITKGDLIAFAHNNDIKNPQEIIEQIENAASTWPQIAFNCGVPSDIIKEIQKNFVN